MKNEKFSMTHSQFPGMTFTQNRPKNSNCSGTVRGFVRCFMRARAVTPLREDVAHQPDSWSALGGGGYFPRLM
jgi:hypothetical protein